MHCKCPRLDLPGSMRSRWEVLRPDLRALALLLLAVVLFFAPVWGHGRVFESDGQFAAFFEPLTVWSDHWIGGWPTIADPVSYGLYPVRIVFRALGSFNAFVIVAYAIAAGGVYAYLRLLGVLVPAALLGGLAFAASGFLLGHAKHTTMLHTAAWLAPALAAVEATLRFERRRAALAFAACVTLLCLAGHSQLVAYGLLQLGLYGLGRLAWIRREARWRGLGLVGAGLALGLALAAPQLLLTSAYLPETPRKELSFQRFVESAAVPLGQLPSFFFPFLFGGGLPPYLSEYFGKWTFAGVCTHVPFLVVVLAAVGAMGGPRGLRLYWLVIAIAAALLTVGDAIPWLASAMYAIPGLGLFRAQGRHAFELSLALAVLAAFGLDAFLRGEQRRVWWMPVALVCAAFASAFVVRGGLSRVMEGRLRRIAIPSWHADPALWMPVGMALLALVALAVAASRRSRRTKVTVVAAVFVAQAVGFGWYMPWVASALPHASWRPTPMESLLLDELQAVPGRLLNVKGVLGTTLTPERSRYFGRSALNWYGPLVPERAASLVGMSPYGAVGALVADPTSAVLDLYGVRYLIVDSLVDPYHWVLLYDDVRWRLVARGDGTSIYENRRARPLAWLVGTWERMADDEARRTIRGGEEVDPVIDVAVKAFVADLDSGTIADFDPGVVRAHWTSAAALAIETDSRSGGLLVVGVNHLPGWYASIDGADVPLHRADHAVMAVRVPGGRHVVRLRYRAPGWQGGASIALLGVAGFALAGVLLRRR
jgi:hypothetical protein